MLKDISTALLHERFSSKCYDNATKVHISGVVKNNESYVSAHSQLNDITQDQGWLRGWYSNYNLHLDIDEYIHCN